VNISGVPVISVLNLSRFFMIKLLPDNSEINHSRGLSMTYRVMIQYQLSTALRIEVAQCLSDIKGWVTNGNQNLTLPVEEQCKSDKFSKILYMEDGDKKISIQCICKYSWKSTLKWQYGYNESSKIQLLQKHFRTKTDYLAIVNRHFNQIILIPRTELSSAEEVTMPILNKMNGKTKSESVYLVPYYNNENLEYYYRSYGIDSSNWIRKTLDGKNDY
jgi:hypothetical protein